MATQNALKKPDVRDAPTPEDIGQLFLRNKGISQFVVSSPGDILVECKLNDQQAIERKVADER
ncbi:MAG: hypothetical protein AAB790_00435 [Patescibacteria group bacterium]